MNGDEDRIIAEAAAWHGASAHDDMDWDGFTAWLEVDPRHGTAYDEVALADALLDEHRDALKASAAEPVADEAPPVAGRRWMRWGGLAIAASLAALLVVPQFTGTPSESYVTQGASRNIALGDGSTVLLAPHSRLTVEGREQERMALAGGAWFDIRHDPSRPLAISASGVTISDIGTQFDVQANNGQIRVEVGQGEVSVASEALSRPIRLTRGHGLFYDGAEGAALVKSVASERIGEWRSGRLSYDSMPLPLVAADLSRYAGISVTVPEALRNRRFSGTLVIGDGEAALRDLSQVMGLEFGRSADGYRLGERTR